MSELRGYCEALCEGRLSDADAAALQRLVLTDAEARRFYIRYTHLHSTLHRTVGGEARLPMIAGAGEPIRPQPPAPHRAPMIGRLVAAMIGIAAMVGCFVLVAALSERGVDADGAGVVVVGPRSLVVDSGSSQFVLRNGTVLLIDGPASATVHSGQWVELEYGTMTLTVPPDAGELTVTAGDVSIRHVGTEFTVIRDDASTEVRVIDGSVVVTRKGESRERIVAAGRGLRSSSAGVVYIDDATIDAERTPLANPDFEQIDADHPHALPGWSSFGATHADPPNVHRRSSPFVEPHGGHSVAKIFGRFDPEATFTGIHQEFDVTPGERCVGSVWIMHTTGDRLVGDSAAWCKLEFTDAVGQTLRHDEADRRLTADTPPDQYIESHVEAAAPPGAARVRFVLIFAQDDKQSPGAALFDDASLQLFSPTESPR